MLNYYKHSSGRIYQFEDECPLSDSLKMTRKAGKAEYIAQCKEELKPYFMEWVDKYGRRNPVIYCNVTKVASSGMSRCIEFYAIKDTELDRITHLIAGAGDYPLTDNGLRVGGCGMDMRFAVLDNAAPIPANNIDIRGL